VNWTKLAESRIEEAIANGEFRDLPGQGQPLDLAEYFAQPATERAGTALLKNANVIPPEVQLLKEIARLEQAILNAGSAENLERPAEGAGAASPRTSAFFHRSSPDHRRDFIEKLRGQLQEKRVTLAMAMERRRRRDPRAVE